MSSPSAAALSAPLTSSSGHVLFQLPDKVDDRDGRRGHAHGKAIELALQLGDDQGHRLGRAGGGGDDVQGGGPGAAGILVRQVQDALVVGVGVDGGHQAALDAKGVVEHLGHWGQAVGRAGGIGDDVVLGRGRNPCR